MPEDVLRAVGGGGKDRLLDLARRHLDMDLAFLAEFDEGEQVFRALAGDASSFGWAREHALPLPGTYCRLMTDGAIPNAVPDAAAVPALADLAVTAAAGIGSYVGVPVRLADGSVYGSLCTVSHAAQQVDHRDVRFLAMLAELLGVELQAERDHALARAEICALIDGGELQIALQPVFDLGTRRLLGVEALSRFPPQSGPPDQVFAAAHAVGAGLELERQALVTAWDVLPLLDDDQYLAVNLSPGVAIELAADAELSEQPLHKVVLEITEHEAVRSYTQLLDALAPARAAGLRLAIDDAGAGFASLQHIVELAPDIIKIDRCLVDGVSSSRSRQSVVKAFATVADDVGATLVAEGIEASADLRTVQNLGVTAAQGYLLGRPSVDRSALPLWQAAGPVSVGS